MTGSRLEHFYLKTRNKENWDNHKKQVNLLVKFAQKVNVFTV